MTAALLPDTPFDPLAERASIATTLLRSAGRLMLGRDERSVVAAICRTLAQSSPHIPVVWTWFGAVDTEFIVPDVCAGRAADYARTLVIRRNLLTRHGPAFRALEGKPLEPFNVSPSSLYGPWRQAAERHGIRNALALSLPSGLPGSGGIFVIYADRPEYFAQVGVSLFEALAEVLGSVLTLAAERKELERAAYHDELTGLLNRNAQPLVERRLQREAELSARSCVLLVDLDHFKRINDERGHAGGDQALRLVAQTLRRVLRREDEALRWGGEEFLILLPGTPRPDALRVAEKLRHSVMDTGRGIGMTCSIGVAEVSPHETLGDAVARADAALYAAKAAGRNQVHTV